MEQKRRFLLILGIILMPIVSALIVRVPLTTAAPPNTLSDKVVELLRELKSNIEALPDVAFRYPNRATKYRDALSSIVETVIKQVAGGVLQGAIGKLNDLIDKIEKWVVEPWKTTLIEKAVEIIGLLGRYV